MDSDAIGPTIFAIAFVLFCIVGIIIGAIRSSDEPKEKFLTNKNSDKTSYLQDPELKRIRTLADEYKQIAFYYDESAHNIANNYGTMDAFSIGRSEMLENIIDLASQGKRADGDFLPVVIYYALGIHLRAIKLFMESYPDDKYYKNNDEFLKIKQKMISYISKYSINDNRPIIEYIDFIEHLALSKTQNEIDDISNAYNNCSKKSDVQSNKLPKELKEISKMDLMDLMAQNAFYSVPVAIIESNSRYFKKGLPHLDFALYYYFMFREVFLSAEIDEEKKEHFKSKMKQHYTEYALRINLVKTKAEAERIFLKRHTWYNLIDIDYDGDEKTLKTTDALIQLTIKELKLSDENYIDILEEVGELLAILNNKAKPLYDNLLEIYETESFFDSANSTLDGTIQHLEECAETIKDEEDNYKGLYGDNVENHISVEEWADSVIEYIATQKLKYVSKNELTLLDFVLYWYFNCYIAFCKIVQTGEKSKEFSLQFYKWYANYVEKKGIDKVFAEEFYWNRIEYYNKIMVSNSNDKDGALISAVEQFVKKSIQETPFEKAFVLGDALETFELNKEIAYLYRDTGRATDDKFKELCEHFKNCVS